MGIVVMNGLTLAIYEKFSTTLVPDPDRDLSRARVEQLETFFPGGLYGVGMIFIPRDVTRAFLWKGGNRVVVRHGVRVVYEGELVKVGYRVGSGAEQGLVLECMGYWGALLGRRTWNKRWADNRLSSDVWKFQAAGGVFGSGESQVTVGVRDGQLSIFPDEKEWLAGSVAIVEYEMPTGETVKRIVADYDFSEQSVASPKRVLFFDGATYSDITNAYDGNTLTEQAISFTTSSYLYIDIGDGSMNRVEIVFNTPVNAVVATLSAEYAAADSSGNESWTALTIVDGTASGGKTWAQDGEITFTRPGDIAEVAVDSHRGRWVRFAVSANLTANVDVGEILLAEVQDWKFSIYDPDNSIDIVSVTTTTFSGVIGSTLGTPTQRIQFRLTSQAKQTPVSDGQRSVYAALIGMTVYSETGSINLTEIAKDVRGKITDLSGDESRIGSNTLSLEPFVTDGQEVVSGILSRAAGFGDGSFNAWYCRLVASELAASPNGKPVLEVGQYPSLGDWDYAVRLDEVVAPFEIVRDFDGLVNWVVVKYRDEENDRDVIITPDDHSNLKDQTSIDMYGERHLPQPLDAGTATETMALNLGQRVLAARKEPRFLVSGPINVVGSIRGKSGNVVAACEIEAGKRVRVENFLNDLVGVSGAGLTFFISGTSYSDVGERCSISVGVPDDLAVWLAQREMGVV